MHTRTHAHRREMGDVRAHGAIYTNTLLHVYLAKYPACRAALDLQPRRRGLGASTRATCPKFLVWCADQLRCTTSSQGTCGIGWARPPASRKGTHTSRRSSPGARAHAAPNEREPPMHGNFAARANRNVVDTNVRIVSPQTHTIDVTLAALAHTRCRDDTLHTHQQV